MSTNLSDLPWQQGDYKEKGLRAELEDFRPVDPHTVASMSTIFDNFSGEPGKH